MKRIWIMLLILAFGLVLAAPAGAGKPNCDPDDPKYTPEHPICQDEEPAEELPMGGTMCDPAEYPKNPDDGTFQIEGVQKTDFSFTLSGKSDGACVNVMSEAGVWKVTIEGEGARYLGVIPRDSTGPGDSCGGWLLRSTIYDFGPDNPLILGYDGTMPATTVNACDYLNGRDFAFAEWVVIDYPGIVPEHCVAVEDGQCLVEDQLPDVPHPIALDIFMRSQDGKTTTFHVDLP